MSVSGTDVLATTLARDAMRAPIVAVDPSATLQEVATLMAHARIHSVVVDGLVRTATSERLVWGVVSDMDVVRALANGGAAVNAGEIAATEAVTVDAGDDLAAVCAALDAHACSHVILVEDDRPAGIISTLDVVSAFGD